MSWSGHWHGYGPWTGSRDTYGQEGLRRPGAHPNDEQTRAFLASTMPPMQTGHWLMRRSQTSADRAWTDLADAVNWLKRTYGANLPVEREDSKQAYIDLDTKADYAEGALSRGSDAVWVHYTKSSNLVSFSVVCCPHRFLPRIPCPLPLL
ncbi:hypothetical protein [Streptomyces sp. NPDC058603]|uniref:hypothetical protein n=1 Tax=unclassified Streptomyces TaxID=2593676 RepID=UPI0036667664